MLLIIVGPRGPTGRLTYACTQILACPKKKMSAKVRNKYTVLLLSLPLVSLILHSQCGYVDL